LKKYEEIIDLKEKNDLLLKYQQEDFFKLDYFNKLFFEVSLIIEKNFNFHLENKSDKNNPFVFSLIGSNNLGITDLLKKICDFKGYYFIKKDFAKYTSINQILNYFKKIEFMQIYCHKIFLIKNADKLFKLIEKENQAKIKSELYNIFSYERTNAFDRNCFVFHFEKNSDLKQEFKDLFSFIISYNLSDSDSREYILRKITNNYLYNYFTLRNLRTGIKIKKRIKNNLIYEIFKQYEKRYLNTGNYNEGNKDLENNLCRESTKKNCNISDARDMNDIELLKLNKSNLSFLEKEFYFMVNFYFVIFTQIDFKELSRLTIGFDLKEFKNLIIYFFSKLDNLLTNKEKIILNLNEGLEEKLFFEFETSQFFKEKLTEFKKSKFFKPSKFFKFLSENEN
jgi:hypothetical protein